jgi:hypothetical protein
MNFMKRFVSGLGAQAAPFGFGVNDPDSQYRAGLSYIGDIGANMLANNQGGVDPLQNLGMSAQQAKEGALVRNRQAMAAQQMMQEAEENRLKREQEAEAKRQQDEWISGLPPEQQGLAKMFPDEFGKSLVDKQFSTPDLTDDMKEYNWAVSNGFVGTPMDYMTQMKKAGASTVNMAGDMKLTEGQSKDLNYYSRGLGADNELSFLENNLLDAASAAGGTVPIIGNYLKDPKYRLAERSAKEFLAIVLRKDTGAAVTQQELELYAPMYLQMPGDKPEDVRAKNISRKRVLQSIRRGAGTARPLYDEIDAEIAAMSGASTAGDENAPEGWDPEDWKYLTPEEKQRARGQ